LSKKKESQTEAEKIKNRVKEMVRERPSHKEVLEFYRDVVIEQNSALSKIKTTPIEIDKDDVKEKIEHGFPIVEKKAFILDIPSAMKLFRRLCKILSKTKKGHDDAEKIKDAIKNKELKLPELFRKVESEDDEYIISLSEKLRVNPEIISFLITNSIKPIYESYSKGLKDYINQERWWKGYCPVCGSEPYISELKDEGGVEGARFLVCSTCGFEWRFNRLKCPFCENGDHEKLRYFYTEKEGRSYRVDVCDNCKRYIKTIDTKALGIEFIPVLEDIGTLHLDILAQKEGYTKEGEGRGLITNA
jgi:FdhE protein